MELYELERIKTETETMLRDITAGLSYLKSYADKAGLNSDDTEMFLSEIKNKLNDYYMIFSTAYEQKKTQLEKEQEQGG